MNNLFKAEERELIKLVNFFKKRADKLIQENKIDKEYSHLLETCDKLVEQLNFHAKNRENVLAGREQLKKLVRDNAHCPKCSKNFHLKLAGTNTSIQGWKSNKYKCRRCNIEFVWNSPNNPWDMIPYVEHFIDQMQKKIQDENLDEAARQINSDALFQMKENLNKLKPIVEASEKDIKEMEIREKEMSAMIHRVKKHLMIEKIRIE